MKLWKYFVRRNKKAEQSNVGRAEPQLDKEPIRGCGCCGFDQSGESSGDHGTPLGNTGSPEPITLESMDFVGSFPEEVTDMILSLLSANDLENCSSVSQLWSSTIKRFQQQQISRLKYNWENGKYSVHCFPISEEFTTVYTYKNTYVEIYLNIGSLEVLSSNLPYDHFILYPLYMHKKASNQFHFSIVGIDAELGMTFNIFQYPIFPGSIKKVWVMGDSLIWFTESEYESVASLHYYNASLVPNTEKRTIYKCAFSHRITSLRMDRNYIAIADDNGYVKVWCKHTLELKFEQNHAFYSQHISLFDGCLVISKPEIGLHVYHKIYPTASVIQIHNLKSDPNHCSTLKHTFSVDGEVQSLDSNSHFIFLIFEHKLIQVISKQSYSIIYSHKYDSFLTREIQRAHDDYIVVKEVSNDQRYRILNLVTRQWSDIIPSCAKKLWTVFDNIAVISNWSDKTLHVFDWKRNTQLLTLAIPEQISRRYIVMSVTELRIVIVDFYSNQVVVFKFG